MQNIGASAGFESATVMSRPNATDVLPIELRICAGSLEVSSVDSFACLSHCFVWNLTGDPLHRLDFSACSHFRCSTSENIPTNCSGYRNDIHSQQWSETLFSLIKLQLLCG
ncbi:hypothetical protein AHF37_12376 [Paragonimus kellicotti]|nr:hypothetical protein AHF37_12376 [Paragonimus kellicotti]